MDKNIENVENINMGKMINSENLIHELLKLKKALRIERSRTKDIVFSQDIALHIIFKNSKNGIISLNALRKIMNIAPSTMTATLSNLESQKFIERYIDKEDRRNILIKITKLGYERINFIHSIVIDKVNGYINYLGQDDLKKQINIIEKTINYINGGIIDETEKQTKK